MKTRIQSIDLLRGIVMVLMAIDHVRVYSGIPSWGATPAIFFTRWVTHFCVPSFVFFAGTSAFLYGQKINDSKKLSRFLFTRGLLLIILEWTIIRFCWTFNLDYAAFTLASVIWMLGWCMILLSLMVRIPARAMGLTSCWLTGLIGGLIIGFQSLFAYIPRFPRKAPSYSAGYRYFIISSISRLFISPRCWSTSSGKATFTRNGIRRRHTRTCLTPGDGDCPCFTWCLSWLKLSCTSSAGNI